MARICKFQFQACWNKSCEAKCIKEKAVSIAAGLSEYEQRLEKIVDNLESLPTLQAINYLKKVLHNHQIEIADNIAMPKALQIKIKHYQQ